MNQQLQRAIENPNQNPRRQASVLLSAAGGVRRNAEVPCWEQVDRAKSAGRQDLHTYWGQVITTIVEGTEDPQVPAVQPRGGWRAPEIEFQATS